LFLPWADSSHSQSYPVLLVCGWCSMALSWHLARNQNEEMWRTS